MRLFPKLEETADQSGDASRVLGFARELLAAFGGDRVKLRAPVVFRGSRLRADQVVLLQTQPGGVDRAFV